MLRKEHFGSIVFNANEGGCIFLNRPATSLLIASHNGEVTDESLASQLGLALNSAACATPPRVVSYDVDLSDSLNYPISATLELTYSCHHACRHCMYSSSPKTRRDHELSREVWARIVEEMASRGLCDIYFSGGEIIRYDGYQELLSLSDRLGLSYLIVSDLASHQDQDFETLAQASNLSTVMVSLDGHEASEHDFLRGAGAFARTVAGIKRLRSDGVTVGIYHSVHSRNLHSFPQFVTFANELGIKNIVAGVACPIGRAALSLSGQTLDNEGCFQLTRYYLDAITSGLVDARNPAWDALATSYRSTGHHQNVFSTWRDFAHAGTHRIHLSPAGEIHLCPKLQTTQFASFGNITRDGVHDVWRGASMSKLRKQAKLKDLIVGVPYMSV
jgi:MoaA/NifB/PqqE/SkfB family radical SAM enzyme